jgi:hypothetical protein
LDQSSRAICVTGAVAGTVSPTAGSGGATWIKPGRRNVAGDTEWEALMPLHPDPNPAASSNALAMTALFNFMVATIRGTRGVATLNFRNAPASARRTDQQRGR